MNLADYKEIYYNGNPLTEIRWNGVTQWKKSQSNFSIKIYPDEVMYNYNTDGLAESYWDLGDAEYIEVIPYIDGNPILASDNIELEYTCNQIYGYPDQYEVNVDQNRYVDITVYSPTAVKYEIEATIISAPDSDLEGLTAMATLTINVAEC